MLPKSAELCLFSAVEILTHYYLKYGLSFLLSIFDAA